VWVVTALSALISIILAIVILCLRNYISYLFTEGEVVSNAVEDLCPIPATTLILNGIQPILSD
jgi:multidrug resistance protein, MATE family